MPDSDAIDSAVVAALRADGTLGTKATGGVWNTERAPGGTSTFVVVRLQASVDHAVMQADDGIGWEEAHYLVKAVGKDPAQVRDAARRIHAVLQDATLAIAGMTCMDVTRTSRVFYSERDGNELWVHRGGLYRVSASH